MESEFDESLDALCSQIKIDLIDCSPKSDQLKFKKPATPTAKRPLYSINRLQQNQTAQLSQHPFTSSSQQQNTVNQSNNTFNKTNQSNQRTNSINNQNRSNQPVKTNQQFINQPNKTGQANVKPNQFTKPLPPSNQTQSTTTEPTTSSASYKNLAKSVIAQNLNCIYSVNKQHLTNNVAKPVNNKFNGSKSNPAVHQNKSTNSNNVIKNNTIKSGQKCNPSQNSGKFNFS